MPLLFTSQRHQQQSSPNNSVTTTTTTVSNQSASPNSSKYYLKSNGRISPSVNNNSNSYLNGINKLKINNNEQSLVGSINSVYFNNNDDFSNSISFNNNNNTNNDFNPPIIMKANLNNNSSNLNINNSSTSYNNHSNNNLNNSISLSNSSSLRSINSNLNSSINGIIQQQHYSNSNNNHSLINNHPRHSISFPSTKTLLPINNTNAKFIKTKRSGSIASCLPFKEIPSSSSINNQSNNSLTSSISNSINFSNSACNNNTAALKDTNMPRKMSNFPILQPKRKKSNSLSLIDYCNILSLNTNNQLLANAYNDTEASMERLSLKTTKQANLQKQATLSEQMAALFGSSMCLCYLCKQKTVDPKKSHQHNFEITPNKNNSDYTITKYTYSTPYSQLSALKLFNLMNTDCSINLNDINQNATAKASNNGKKNFLYKLILLPKESYF